MKTLNLIAIAFLCTLVSTNASARTWYVTVDGTGDAPTIPAAMDSASSGDIVLVAAGHYTYSEPGVHIPAGVTLMSESGPLETIIEGKTLIPYDLPPYTVALSDNAECRGFWVRGGQLASVLVGPPIGGAIVRGNIIGQENAFPATVLEINGSAALENNLIARDALFGAGAALSTIQLNIFLGDFVAGGAAMSFVICNDILGVVDAALTPGFNFALDPEFCGLPGTGNYYLRSTSPCAHGNDPIGCTLGLPTYIVGPLPVGCGAVSIERRSWGAVKKLYGE